VVENRPGAGTVIGTEAVERAEPDGHTVLLVANSFVVNPALKRASYDPTRSFDPVCYLAATPMVLVVLGSSPYRTPRRFDRRGAREARRTRLRERRTRLLAACRHRGAQARGEHQRDVRAIWRHRARRQRADGQSTSPRSGPIIHGRVAARLRHATRARHHLARAGSRRCRTCPPSAMTGISNYEADIFYGIVAPAKTPAGSAHSVVRLVQQRGQGSRHEAQARAARPVSGRNLRRGIRRHFAAAGRGVQPYHSRGEHHGQIAPHGWR